MMTWTHVVVDVMHDVDSFWNVHLPPSSQIPTSSQIKISHKLRAKKTKSWCAYLVDAAEGAETAWLDVVECDNLQRLMDSNDTTSRRARLTAFWITRCLASTYRRDRKIHYSFSVSAQFKPAPSCWVWAMARHTQQDGAATNQFRRLLDVHDVTAAVVLQGPVHVSPTVDQLGPSVSNHAQRSLPTFVKPNEVKCVACQDDAMDDTDNSLGGDPFFFGSSSSMHPDRRRPPKPYAVPTKTSWADAQARGLSHTRDTGVLAIAEADLGMTKQFDIPLTWGGKHTGYLHVDVRVTIVSDVHWELYLNPPSRRS
ncbi:hypothetical protein H257_06554 [Aphanomyces astaci]|uniref:Uncharacterized protein n=1 Tax=Aphanomyces astaci TaxID=112090 RepID=W4GKI0_APHAT|nr:hypothetical protein H257_06554 [Aphanomyces astaci]ETV80195.1 hypothetical protein H257_06554 [Aphanomyces astaci]|eukprot:XP_009830119.1 hypothetical protein H257_06554 [Aphanomyces astaci]